VLRRAISARKPGALMMLGLGPSAHWTSRLPLCAMILVFGVGLRVLLVLANDSSDASFGMAGWVLMLTLVVIFQLGFFGQWKGVIAAAGNELAVIKLAALRPDARKWNRSFAKALVANELAFCGMLAATTILLALLNGADRDMLISMAALSTTLVMPGIAWVLRDYSVEHEWRSSARGLLLAVPAAVVALAGLVAMLGLQIAIGAWAWVLLSAASNLIGALVAAWRWKKMAIVAPGAVPA
jgi:hypothetical protein